MLTRSRLSVLVVPSCYLVPFIFSDVLLPKRCIHRRRSFEWPLKLMVCDLYLYHTFGPRQGIQDAPNHLSGTYPLTPEKIPQDLTTFRIKEAEIGEVVMYSFFITCFPILSGKTVPKCRAAIWELP